MVVAQTRAPLFVPANRPERFAKAAASGTDAVILDLEDAVALDAKDAARNALAADFTDLPVFALHPGGIHPLFVLFSAHHAIRGAAPNRDGFRSAGEPSGEP